MTDKYIGKFENFDRNDEYDTEGVKCWRCQCGVWNDWEEDCMCYKHKYGSRVEVIKRLESVDMDKLDELLAPAGLDWSFDNPSHLRSSRATQYMPIYIIPKEEEE